VNQCDHHDQRVKHHDQRVEHHDQRVEQRLNDPLGLMGKGFDADVVKQVLTFEKVTIEKVTMKRCQPSGGFLCDPIRVMRHKWVRAVMTHVESPLMIP